ncbi:spore germination protein [Thermoanaerobacter kivui]|uniref:Spore germination protein n=1 Tax=Thermoanaerobacter kivui TaxID=2325 RepID=A0A097AUB4_THEKI|nr:endospore germination permease [Thermoanaerobacter kivui]AIS53414.1 spore germination protein [Thermoanaerobacter kivui]
MIKNNDKISANQVCILLFTTMVGAGILSLPADVSKEAGPNGLIAILAGGFISLFFARMILYISSSFATETFVEYTAKLITKPISVIVSITLTIYFMIFVSLDARIFGEVLKIYLLPSTPIEIIILTMLFTSAYLVRYGLEPIARMSEILFPIIVIPLMLLFLPALTDVDVSNFLPIMRIPFCKFLKGILLTTYSFVGFEILYMLFPYVFDSNKLRKSVNVAMISTMLFYMYITFFVIGIFGYKETKEQLWPFLTLIKSLNFPVFFIENVDGIVMGIWTFTIFTSIYSFHYFAVLTISKIVKSREHSYFVLPLIPIMYSMALIPDSIVTVYKYAGYVSQYMSIFFIAILPVVLFIILKLKKAGAKDEEKT